jgi:putative spermidine/putrescine transport system permease protein
VPGRRRLPLAWLVLVPFFAYALLFLFLPSAQVMVGAFKDEHGGFTTGNVSAIVHTNYLRSAFEVSIRLSLETAFWGALFGFLLAYAVVREGVPRWIRPLFTTFSGVAANFGGIPLAFAFISTVGTIGIITRFLHDQLGFDLYSWTPPLSDQPFSLFSFIGVSITYLYFQIPLMLLVISPAIDGLKREWREASSNLGASSFQFWRYVGMPVLFPSIISAFILLFGNSFAAYATAYALTSGTGLNLVPIVIGNDLTGNVLNNPHEGQALAFGMFVVLAAMMLVYVPLQRRTSRWAR